MSLGFCLTNKPLSVCFMAYECDLHFDGGTSEDEKCFLQNDYLRVIYQIQEDSLPYGEAGLEFFRESQISACRQLISR